MSFMDSIRSLNELDLGDIDFENIGGWPIAAKVVIALVLLIATVVGGYYYHIEDLQRQTAQLQGREAELRRNQKH